jgi:hypothetical protein
MDLLTPLDTYCRLIIRAREMEAQVPAQDPDEDPDDVDDLEGGGDDDDRQGLSALSDEMNDVEEEVAALLDDLADDQLAEAVALAWVGLGTFDVSEWEDACAEANDLDPDERIDELMNMPTLAANMEAGLAAFDYNCDDVGQLD